MVSIYLNGYPMVVGLMVIVGRIYSGTTDNWSLLMHLTVANWNSISNQYITDLVLMVQVLVNVIFPRHIRLVRSA